MKKVFISTTSFAEFDAKPVELLKKEGLSVSMNDKKRKLTESEIQEYIRDVNFLIAGTEKISKKVFSSAKKLKVISRCGVGVDNVDLNAAHELGIMVFNTPDGPTLAVAEMTVALMLNLVRRVSESDRNIRRGHWEKYMGNLLKGKKIGIIGFGKIGRQVAALLNIFSVEIAYCDIRPIKTEYKEMALKKLLTWADIISIHASSLPDGRPILGEKEISFLRKDTWLVNMARGNAIDENALYKALVAKKIAGAALDVFAQEPYEGPLVGLENVILTPHIGSYAKEARIAMEKQAVDNLLAAIKKIK